jgi:hypothetical protein
MPTGKGKNMLSSNRFPGYGYVGIAIMLVSEILMLKGFHPISGFFTPVVWTGYILIADAYLFNKIKVSFIQEYGAQFFSLCVYSVGFWVVFEYYNLLLKNWYYKNLPDSLTIRMIGYLWSFATILPGILITSEIVKLQPWIRRITNKKIEVTKKLLNTWVVLGAVLMIFPLILPSPYLFAPVWLGVIFLIDPINYKLGKRSLLRDFETGDWSSFYAVMIGGYICGLLWEFWNYWAATKWIYTVPILPEVKIFEMPVLGFLGFGPFALECYVATNLIFGDKDRWRNVRLVEERVA